jgi:hypothetical protein
MQKPYLTIGYKTDPQPFGEGGVALSKGIPHSVRIPITDITLPKLVEILQAAAEWKESGGYVGLDGRELRVLERVGAQYPLELPQKGVTRNPITLAVTSTRFDGAKGLYLPPTIDAIVGAKPVLEGHYLNNGSGRFLYGQLVRAGFIRADGTHT